ncbi:hypothetical protein EDB85DRAFT_1007232 [Lactarius pseudohatsudake]|nr:hypothetical protein EDB85DRAFT_1007232 [Lactarius pseudohatsudake]
MKWINPMVDVLLTFSAKLSEGAALAPFPPAKVIVVGIAVLLAVRIFASAISCAPLNTLNTDIVYAAKDVRASHNALVEVFELGIVA